ncbi:hypothetical protein E2P81_ATG09045 [Venturia nashicola]|uniref:Secreted protein n=1 Tax=Venturia nashicola TaxID=86259 RepID=A0A4Z1NKS2_9PEZI|nr:hypothetical protein E6O75_ATG09243 [Venturia nashicola]TLD23701.1 hypothetical protein E2P81_ATG09045 [Venturia nashicola]
MYGFKQLLVLALAQSALACRCTEYGVPTGKLDPTATEQACAHAGGTMSDGHKGERRRPLAFVDPPRKLQEMSDEYDCVFIFLFPVQYAIMHTVLCTEYGGLCTEDYVRTMCFQGTQATIPTPVSTVAIARQSQGIRKAFARPHKATQGNRKAFTRPHKATQGNRKAFARPHKAITRPLKAIARHSQGHTRQSQGSRKAACTLGASVVVPDR